MIDKETFIPSGWEAATLGEITCKLVDGSHNPPSKKSSGLPMLSAVNIDNNRIDFSSYRLISETEFEAENKRTRITAGDVLLTIVGAIGRAAVVPEYMQRFTLQRSVAVFTPILIDSKFLMYQFESPDLANYFRKNARGTAQKGIYLKVLSGTKILVPPLNEQKRIVAKIEELFSELDSGIENLKTAREQLKVYRHCILDEAASGKILVSAGAAKAPFPEKIYVPMSSIISDLGQGWSPKCYEHPSPNEDVWGVIKTTAIQHLEFDGSENKELPAQLEPRKHLEIKTNDILITRAGPRNRVGVACLVKNVRKRLILCDKAYRLRVDETKILPEYLVMLLNTPKVIFKIEEIKTGINDSGVNLTQNRFLELKLPVPSLETQRQILLELEAKLSNITYLEGQVESSLSQSDALRQSILKKAFSGQLVAQNPADEPASLLLERIRNEKQKGKEKQPSKPKKRAA